MKTIFSNSVFSNVIFDRVKEDLQSLNSVSVEEKIEIINKIKLELKNYSPFSKEPVDCVLWVKCEEVMANDYNPNSVAPPEMRLLETSINEDGYTQPIVAWKNEDMYEVVDGFHRNRVGRECDVIKKRVMGYLPLSIINSERLDRGDRIAATIRHNRARGKHKVDSMSDIVVELKKRGWLNERIGRELGMEQDEILRLCQVTGLAELFSDQQFSKSWEVKGQVDENDFKELTDDASTYEENTEDFRTVNTSDKDRIFHTFDKWECHKAGFYNSTKEGMTKQQCIEAYKNFLSDTQKFSEALEHVIVEWKYSCEHYLTNSSLNRIAWLGQASMCYATGVPSVFRSGFSLLTEKQQQEANETALLYLNKWLEKNKRKKVSMEEALCGKQMDIY